MATNYLLVSDAEGRPCGQFELTAETRSFRGWSDMVSGWAIGSLESDAVIRIDEPALDRAELGIIAASNHVFVYGRSPEDATIEIGRLPRGGSSTIEHPSRNEAETIEIRFDQRPLQVGRFVLEYFSTQESLDERLGRGPIAP